jgi:hypothetical protein
MPVRPSFCILLFLSRARRSSAHHSQLSCARTSPTLTIISLDPQILLQPCNGLEGGLIERLAGDWPATSGWFSLPNRSYTIVGSFVLEGCEG